MADRVVLIEAGRVALDLPIALSRPRNRSDAACAALVEHILERVLNSGATRKEQAEVDQFAFSGND